MIFWLNWGYFGNNILPKTGSEGFGTSGVGATFEVSLAARLRNECLLS
ncbi:MAG: hypothetical protein U5M51_09770 [Emticicia sp.]|nr:hypothetical protein [Emticicia sp.]